MRFFPSIAGATGVRLAAPPLRALLHGLVDYAGIFPPARLGLGEAVENYSRYQRSGQNWTLGRFIVPLARLAEFERALDTVRDESAAREPWKLSVLLGNDMKADAETIRSFNHRRAGAAQGPEVRIESAERKVATPEEIANAAEQIPPGIETYFEVPLTDDLPTLVAEIRKVKGRAKVRTGGETAPLFPSCGQIAFFLGVCRAAEIPFKATAGLHHPLRSYQRFTYAADSPSGMMHGFLNVFAAGAFVLHGMNAKDAESVLSEESAEAFRFEAGGISWRDKKLTSEAIQSARQSFCTSFGSCSFTEPVADLQTLHLL
ncbi:MAG TPA: hypothetical protein VK525_07045 [Candidatus Saccharimonadales bacterium]|nr:hypothetical protein [Candidatus Saccharimonadales bacterium]